MLFLRINRWKCNQIEVWCEHEHFIIWNCDSHIMIFIRCSSLIFDWCVCSVVSLFIFASCSVVIVIIDWVKYEKKNVYKKTTRETRRSFARASSLHIFRRFAIFCVISNVLSHLTFVVHVNINYTLIIILFIFPDFISISCLLFFSYLELKHDDRRSSKRLNYETNMC